MLFNLPECMCCIDTSPQNKLRVWEKKSVLLEENYRSSVLKRKTPTLSILSLCPELLHSTTSREMGIHSQACTAVTKPFFTKSSWKLN